MMSGVWDGVPIDEPIASKLSNCSSGGGQMSSPDTSVTSTSICEDHVTPVTSDRFALDGQGSCVDDGYADVTSSCENLLSGITCCASPLFESHADESMANAEDIDNIQATLSPLDGLLLADLTGCDSGTVGSNELFLPDFCADHGDCSLAFLGSPGGLKGHECSIGYETLAAANNSLLSLAQSIQPLSNSFLDSWQDGYSDELSSSTFVPNPTCIDQLQHMGNEHPVQEVCENLLASHDERSSTDYTGCLSKNTSDEIDQNKFLESIATIDFQAHSNPAVSMNDSQSTAPLDVPFDLVNSNPESSLILTFDSSMPIPSSMGFCASSPLACTSGTELNDSMNVSDLDNRGLHELLQSTELSHDIMLAAERVSQSALMLAGEASGVNTLDDLPLIDLDTVSESCQERSPVFDDENFDLDDSHWSYVQNWSSSVVPNPSSLDNVSETKQGGRGKKFKTDRTSRRDLRRSSRIQDYELRDLAQKIREENQLKERLETEMQGLMGKSPVTRAESPKLKLFSCEVELQRVESPSLHKTQQSADLKRKSEDTEALTDSRKPHKNSHVEYIDDSETETEDTLSVLTNTEVERHVSKAKKVSRKKRQRSDCKFRSYSVMFSVDEPADGSPRPGKLKLKLKKLKDDGGNSSPEMPLDIRVTTSGDQALEDLGVPVDEESGLAMSTIVVKSSELTEDKPICGADVETLSVNASGNDSILGVDKCHEKAYARNESSGVMKDSKVKKVGIVKPVQKEMEVITDLDLDTTSEWSPSVMDSLKPECGKSPDDTSDCSFVERPSKSVHNKVSDVKQRSDHCSRSNAAVRSDSRHSDATKCSKLSENKDKKLHKKKDVISLDELREISASAKAPMSTGGSSQFLMPEKDLSTKAKVRKSTKAAGLISKTHEKVVKVTRDSVVGKCKGALECRGRNCHKLITNQSVYCGDSCLQLHVAESIALFSPESKHSSQNHKETTMKDARDDERIVVFERSTGKLVTGAHAPTPATLLAWIRKHPTFEVVQSSAVGSNTLKKKSHTTKSPTFSCSSSSSKETRIECTVTDGGVKKPKVDRPDKKHHHDKDCTSKHTIEKLEPRSFSDRTDATSRSAEVSWPASNMDRKRTAETVRRSASVKATGEILPTSKQITDEQKKDTKNDEQKKESKDAARNHVRKGFYRALTARVSELTDASGFGATQLKRLSESVEEELCKYYGGVNSLYQRKYRALVSHLTDSNNQGLFRRVIYGYLKPTELVQINSQLLGSARWSKLPAERPSCGSGTANIPAKVPSSKRLDVASSSSVHASTSKTVASVAGMKRKIESVPIVSIDTTSRHGQHLFDVYCKICTGTAETADVKPKQSVSDDRINHTKENSDANSIIAKPSLTMLPGVVGSLHSTSDESLSRAMLPDVSHLNFTSVRVTSQAILPDFSHLYSLSSEITSRTTIPDVSRLDSSSSKVPARTTKPDVCPIELASSEATATPSTKTASVTSVSAWPSPSNKLISRQDAGSCALVDKFRSKFIATPASPVENLPFPQITPPAPLSERSAIDEIVWSGSVVAQDIATIKATAHRISGSMKIMKNELPESLTVVGRIPPDIVCDYLNKIKRAPVITREIAVVFFTPHRDESDVEGYDQLFKYLIERHRCAAFGSIGDSIKDMYIWPLARDSMVPSVLLPLTRPGLPADRKDLLLGVVVQHLSSRYHPKRTLPPQPVSEPSLIPLTSKEEVEFSSVEKVKLGDCSANEKESNVTSVFDQPGGTHQNSVEPAKIPVTSTVPLCDTRVDNGDEPYEPVDEEVNWLPSAKSSDSIVSNISPDAAVSTENRLLAALGDRTEVERFTTCIDKLLKIAKNKTDDAFIAEELNQKQQLLMQLNGLIRNRIQSQEQASASSSGRVITSSELERKPVNSTGTVENFSHRGKITSSCLGTADATAASSASDGSETEMDKFLAWKSRLEGLGCGKPSSSKSSGVDSVGSGEQKAAVDVSSRYHGNVMTDAVSIPAVGEENSDNDSLASVQQSAAAVPEQKAPSNEALVGLLVPSVSRGKSEVSRLSFSGELTTIAAESSHSTTKFTTGVGSSSLARCTDASRAISPIKSPSTPDANSTSSSENPPLFNFPPLSTPPKPPENLLKINFDQCCNLPLMPPAFPVLRDSSWRMPDTSSAQNRIVAADKQPDNAVSFSPASPPADLAHGDADSVGLLVNWRDSTSVSIGIPMPVLSRPLPFPYLLASPLSNSSSAGDTNQIVTSVNLPLQSDIELTTNDSSRLRPPGAVFDGPLSRQGSSEVEFHCPVGLYPSNNISQNEPVGKLMPSEMHHVLISHSGSFQNRLLDSRPSELHRDIGVELDFKLAGNQASCVTQPVGHRSDENIEDTTALEEDSSLCCGLYGAAYSSHSAGMFVSGESLHRASISNPDSKQSISAKVTKKTSSGGDRRPPIDDRSCFSVDSTFGELSMNSSVSTGLLEDRCSRSEMFGVEAEDLTEDEQHPSKTERGILVRKIHSDTLIDKIEDSSSNTSELDHNQDLSVQDGQDNKKWFGIGTTYDAFSSEDESGSIETSSRKDSRSTRVRRSNKQIKHSKGERDCRDVFRMEVNIPRGLSAESDHDVTRLSHSSHQRSTQLLAPKVHDVPDYLPAPPRVRDRSTMLLSPRDSSRYGPSRSISEVVRNQTVGHGYPSSFSSRDKHFTGIVESHDRTSTKLPNSRDSHDTPRSRSDRSPRRSFKSKPSTVSVLEDYRFPGSQPRESQKSTHESSKQLVEQDKSLETWLESRRLPSQTTSTKPKGLSFSVDETFDDSSEESMSNQSSCHARRNPSDSNRNYRHRSEAFELESTSELDKVTATTSSKVVAGHRLDEGNQSPRNDCSVDELEDGEIVDSNDESHKSPPCSPLSSKLLPPPKASSSLRHFRSSRDGDQSVMPGSTTKIETSRRSSAWSSRKVHHSSHFY